MQSPDSVTPKAPATTCPEVCLPRQVWAAHADAHHARVAPITEPHQERRRRGQTHPVWDFLFTYYSFRPQKLLTWVPGVAPLHPHETLASTNLMVWKPPPLRERIRVLAPWVVGLCDAILDRPGRFHCFALHEWAMVYRLPPQTVRHQSIPLRVDATDVARLVEGQTIACTHYDAYRFFTTAASPLNTLRPGPDTRSAFEQSGCLHTNMDLYKWTAKLWPWIGSDLLGETFALAAEARTLDMRASPYDLEDLGFAPIRIETAGGRQHFQEAQMALAQRAEPLRGRLREAANVLAKLPVPA